MFIKATYVLFIAATLFLTSCAKDANSIETNEATPSQRIEDSAISTATVPPTNMSSTPRPTYTSISNTPTPPIVPDTPTPTVMSVTVTAKPTATATLSHEQIDANLTELMLTNDGCELPCWWGIVPGETLMSSAREKLTALGASWIGDLTSTIGVDWGMGIEFEIDNDTIQTMDINSSYFSGIERDKYTRGWQPHSLVAVLEQYGLPTQVLAYKPFEADPGQPSYHLLVFYEDLGIEIDYIGSVEILGDNRYLACPEIADIWKVHVFLYQPSQVNDVVEKILPASSISYIADSETVYEVISWQQATGTSLESFFETYSTSEGTCFEFLTP
jgi:hypothetical protein